MDSGQIISEWLLRQFRSIKVENGFFTNAGLNVFDGHDPPFKDPVVPRIEFLLVGSTWITPPDNFVAIQRDYQLSLHSYVSVAGETPSKARQLVGELEFDILRAVCSTRKESLPRPFSVIWPQNSINNVLESNYAESILTLLARSTESYSR